MLDCCRRWGELQVNSETTLEWLSLQVKVQTVPGYAKGLTDGLPKVIAQEGVGGCAPHSSARPKVCKAKTACYGALKVTVCQVPPAAPTHTRDTAREP